MLNFKLLTSSDGGKFLTPPGAGRFRHWKRFEVLRVKLWDSHCGINSLSEENGSRIYVLSHPS